MWLLAPTAIEADFRFRGLRIADWLTGTMSSREFLVLVQHLPGNSEFKTGAPQPFGRDGDWPESLRILAETHKELALYRAAKYVGSPNEYVPQIFITPSERLAAYAESQEEQLAGLELEAMLSMAIDQ